MNVKRYIKILAIFAVVFCILFTFIFNLVIFPLKFKKEVKYYSTIYNVKPELIFAIIKAESGFNANVISPKGATGLMQILPSTADWLSKKLNEPSYDLTDPNINIKFGTFYLSYLTEKFKNADIVICAYNAGEGIVKKWLADSNYSSDGVALNCIPYNETKQYLSKVKKYQQVYKFKLK